jgi:hypothetical protein
LSDASEQRQARLEVPRHTGATMFPVLALNVFRFPTRREPTVRAAEACPPPFMETDYLDRGGQRPVGPRRGKRLLSAVVPSQLAYASTVTQFGHDPSRAKR